MGSEYDMEELDAEIRGLMRGRSPSDCLVPTKSLYEAKMEMRETAEGEPQKSLLHRISIVSQIRSDGNFPEIGQHYEKYFKDLANQYQTEAITGLLLLYPKHCVHVVETCQEVILDLLRALRVEAKSEDGNMGVTKVLAVSHDIPHRLYQQWSCRILDIEPHSGDDTEPSDAAEGMVSEMLTQLLKLGSHINRQPKVAMKNTMDSLHDKVPELLPQQDILGYLTEADNKCVATLKEYLNIYEKPYDVTLSSELTWPMPVRLFPYH